MGCQSGKCSSVSAMDKIILQDPISYGRELVNQLITIEIQIEQLRSQMYKENDIEYEKSEFIISFEFDYNTVHSKSQKHTINSQKYVEKSALIKDQFAKIIPQLVSFNSALKNKHYKYAYQMQIEEVSNKLQYKYSEITSYLNYKRKTKTQIMSKEIISPINSSDTFQTDNEAYTNHQTY